VTHHVLHLVYAFEAVMVLAGLLLRDSAVEHVGVVALGATLAIHTVVLVLQDLSKGRKRWLRIALFVVVLVLLLASILGLIVIVGGFRAIRS